MGDPRTFAPVVGELAAHVDADPTAGRRPPGALDIRRRVESFFHRELSEPSEELVHFVSARLGLDEACDGDGETREMCRTALREMGRVHWSRTAPVAGRRDSNRRQLDRRRFEQHREPPGYYLG